MTAVLSLCQPAHQHLSQGNIHCVYPFGYYLLMVINSMQNTAASQTFPWIRGRQPSPGAGFSPLPGFRMKRQTFSVFNLYLVLL